MTGKKNREEPAVHNSLGCGVPDNESCWIWWCVSLLTLVAMGVQGQDVKEPWAPYMVTPEAAARIGGGINPEITGPPA